MKFAQGATGQSLKRPYGQVKPLSKDQLDKNTSRLAKININAPSVQTDSDEERVLQKIRVMEVKKPTAVKIKNTL